jgi:hypothetical protein
MQNQVWNQGFLKIGNRFVDWYLLGLFKLESLARLESVREGLNEVYNVLVKTGEIVRLEDLNQESKTNIWNDCKPFIETLSTPDRIKFCKCYWALSCLAQKRNI